MKAENQIRVLLLFIGFAVGVVFATLVYWDLNDTIEQATEIFITRCNQYLGEGDWKVIRTIDGKWTCMGINDSVLNITLPVPSVAEGTVGRTDID